MAYEDKTSDLIHLELLKKITDDIDKRQGSIVHDMTYPAAIELANAYRELNKALRRGFADTSTGTWLERRCAELGIERKPAIKASGFVTFSGDDGTEIPAGTIVETDIGIQFKTLQDASIVGSSVLVEVEAVEGGTDGNVSVGDITIVVGDLQGVVTVTNESSFDNGVDEESDDALRERYFERVRKPIMSGNVSHYKQWALEVAGIGDAKIYPLANGPGTVKVVVLGADGRAPVQDALDEVNQHINDNRPVGADVSVVSAIEDEINVSVTLSLESGKALVDVQDEIESNINDYIMSLPFGDTTVRYNEIGSAIIEVDGVIDYSNLTVNGGTTNIQVDDNHVAVIGTVTLSE